MPNVSYCVQENEVHYNPYIKPETRLVCKYNVTSTSEPTALRTNNEQNIFKSMEIDGVMLDELVTAYTFDTTGVHTVKYELYDDTKLGNQGPVFYNNNLVECIIPDGVTSIGERVFWDCSGLTSVTIGDGVISIGNYAFASCSGLTSVTIPNSVTSIGNYAFQHCHSLTSVTIGSGVETIGEQTFAECTSLTSIVIPDGVTSIGNNAFGQCSGLTSVTVNATTPPTLGYSVFGSTNDCPIYVPSASVETYKSASGWSTYADRIQAIQ